MYTIEDAIEDAPFFCDLCDHYVPSISCDECSAEVCEICHDAYGCE